MRSGFGFAMRCVRIGCLLAAGLVAGCATYSSGPERVAVQGDVSTDFSLQGRFSLRHEDRNYSGRLDWQHIGANSTVLLSSPFGQGMAEIRSGADGAHLTTSDGKQYVAADTQTLTAQVLGYPLPLTELTEWVRGRVAGETGVERDAQGRLARLRSADWRIDYSYGDDDPQALPNLLVVERGGELELRLRIDEWNGALPGGGQP
jgi:outer membrane lipoprotein LolB